MNCKDLMFLLIFAETVGVLSVSALIRKAKLFCTAWNARFAAIIRFTPFESKCGSSGKPAVFRPAVSGCADGTESCVGSGRVRPS